MCPVCLIEVGNRVLTLDHRDIGRSHGLNALRNRIGSNHHILHLFSGVSFMFGVGYWERSWNLIMGKSLGYRRLDLCKKEYYKYFERPVEMNSESSITFLFFVFKFHLTRCKRILDLTRSIHNT